ncbi:helix-turn-helix transcriptional regulator [Saccharothrix xinjiangensis]|uniref:Helix-turn-helix domain-containing protein n=1 Tax=Saccharothrix xinjiangensis TaxID=204798 RepID=A0ABV9Y5J4_9PSEU
MRSRTLGAELRNLRHSTGLQFGALVEALGVSPGWLSKLETGSRRTSALNVARLLGFYRVDTETFNYVMNLCHDLDAGNLIWSHGLGGVDEVPVLLRHEKAAREIFCYDVVGIPALAQSEDHMRAVFGRSAYLDADGVERCVTARKVRQEVLTSSRPLKCTFIVRELTLRHLGSDREAVWGQLMHLFWLGHTGKVNVRVIGRDVPSGYWDQFSFTLMRSFEFRPVVHIDVTPCSLFLDDPQETDVYAESARLLMGNAMGAEESQAFIGHLAGKVGASAELRH